MTLGYWISKIQQSRKDLEKGIMKSVWVVNEMYSAIAIFLILKSISTI